MQAKQKLERHQQAKLQQIEDYQEHVLQLRAEAEEERQKAEQRKVQVSCNMMHV